MEHPAVSVASPNNSHAARAEGAWLVLVDALGAETDHLAKRVSAAIRAKLPAYRLISAEAFDVEVGREVERVLRSARTGRAALDDGEIAEVAAIGETRARQGIPVDDLLRAWRIGVEVLVGCARESAQHLGVGEVQVLEFVQAMLAWSDVAMVATASAHRRTELAQAVAVDDDRAKFVRGVLLGAIPAVELRTQAEMLGLEPAGAYVAVRARLGDDVSRRELEQALGFRDSAVKSRGLCALVDGELAGFRIGPPPADVDGVVGFGPARPLEHLSESYRLAARALLTVEACGMRGAHDLAALGIRAAVATDTDVGELLRQRYLEPLSAGGSADDVIATLRAYLACGMRVEATATRLFVHQNTVRYRLSRFEELTGASLRETEVLIELWWALELAAMQM